MDLSKNIPFRLRIIALNHKGISAGLLPRQNEALESGREELTKFRISLSASVSAC